jgi:uncharacterized protein YndB with AHSA1/START domain
MDTKTPNDSAADANPTSVERESDRELIVTRAFNAPAALVFKAWTTPDLLRRWWAPKSFGVTFVSCEADVRPGGAYRFVFKHPSAEQPMAFFGKYLEVERNARLVWTNEEGAEGGQITTVTFEDRGAATVVVMHELYPSKAALDEAMSSGGNSGFNETFAQLDEMLADMDSH